MSPTEPVIVIAGNPNVGKTTLFNALTGARQKIANYPGVTVERKEGSLALKSGQRLRVIDVPGTYSLIPKSDDEQVAHDVLVGQFRGLPAPELVIYVADASNLERTLFLFSQIRDFGLPAILALNMMDIAAERGIAVDTKKLSDELGVPVIELVGHKSKGVDALRQAIETARVSPPAPQSRRPWPLRPEVEQESDTLGKRLAGRPGTQGIRPEAEALWLLTAVEDPRTRLRIDPELRKAAEESLRKLNGAGIDVRTETIQGRYTWLNPLAASVQRIDSEPKPSIHDRIDAVVTNRYAGPVIFLLVMTLMFQAVFSWANPLIGVIELLIGNISGFLTATLPENLATDLLINGIVKGVGNVIAFLPQILTLFLFMSLLEDIGYMSRAALIAHRIMSKLGLPGKAFIPLMSSFACAIPGIMATRTIEDKRDRMITICIAPLISCSARLPVYALVIAAVFNANQRVLGIFTEGGLVMLSMYFLSILMAVTAAAVMKRTILPAPKSGFIMELPPYRMPRWKDTLLNMVQRSNVFLTEAGTVILTVTVALWFLLSFPRSGPEVASAEQAKSALVSQLETVPSPSRARLEQEIVAARNRVAQERLRHSYAGRIGRILEPVIAPLGFDWKIGIGLVGSFAAREVLVSTLGVVYGLGDVDTGGGAPSLRDRIRTERDPLTGRLVFTPLVGLSLMVFFVLACQCMSTLAIIRRETRSLRWPAFVFTYMTILAWTCSFAVYQSGRLMGFQ